MNQECLQFTGRRRAICRGEADLPLETINAYRRMWGLPPLDGPAVQSRGLGDRISSAIRRLTFGLVKQCVGCKGRAEKLNHLFPANLPPESTQGQ
jgi:hypothetical protein